MSLPERVRELARAGKQHVDIGAVSAPDTDRKPIHVLVMDATGEVLYHTWQGGPLGDWSRATLYFNEADADIDGNVIGLSLWD